MSYLQGPFTVTDGFFVLSQLDVGLVRFQNGTVDNWTSKIKKIKLSLQNKIAQKQILQ